MLKRRSPVPAVLPKSGLKHVESAGDGGLSRRDFLRASGIGGLALAGIGAGGTVQRAEAQTIGADIVRRKTVCPFCS
ncbi:MAG TPA: twin-arginine translocation signal domain-containing protein, partial [Paracoccaceae bacterium]|nr:twin-arginine translocation signal domain-containing protein [Paracoccaceae bacterium]